ncbi:KRFJ protein, partial [Penelope pileata]|nr:KRFJ protein [Penelope pileata]
CASPCEVTCDKPYVNSWNEPCVTSCRDSSAIVWPPPVVITFPGPTMSSCPQDSYVGTVEPVIHGGGNCSGGSYGGGGSGGGGICSGGSYGGGGSGG